MDAKYKDELKPGTRVVVYMGAAIPGVAPICTTATVLEAPEDEFVWVGIDFTSNDEQLPQRYRVAEILGFLLPLAHVEYEGSVMVGTVKIPGTEGHAAPEQGHEWPGRDDGEPHPR